MARRFDCRRVKLHHSYTISELSALIGAHKHTIGRWIAAGLKTTDLRRPLLVHGADFRAFMKAREPVKQRCQSGEFYCLGCRAPRRPALDMADYRPRTALRGSLSGICPACERMIYRAATLAKLDQVRGGLNVAFPTAEQRLDGGVGSGSADAARLGRGEGRSFDGLRRRPPDSFARVRDEARRNGADPYGARLAFREGLTRDAWEKLTPAERDAFGNERQSIWPDEPALSRVDDGTADWMDRVRATGNQVVPQIPQLIGRAIADALSVLRPPISGLRS